MKQLVKLFAALIMVMASGRSLAQTKMTMTINGKESDLFGYAFDSVNGSLSKEIDLFGPMQNASTILQLAYTSANAIPEIDIAVSDPNRNPEFIKLTQVNVLSYKEYISTYSDGYFTVSPGGNVNSAVKCRFQKIEIENTSSKNTAPQSIKENPANIVSGNDKFEIKPAPLKGVTGKISVSFPADADCEIKIYNPDENNKYLGSFNSNNNILMFPGNYTVSLSNAEVKNVPVQKGMETRIKGGILSLVSPIEYKLYDESKKKYIRTFNGPKKIGLPVGKFQLSINNRFQLLTIKDGETLEM